MLAPALFERAQRVATIAAQHCGDVDRAARFPSEAVAALKAERLMGLPVAGELGGEDASLEDLTEICCLLGQACSATAMIYAMHLIKVGSLVSHSLDSRWHRDFMRRLCDEQLLLASATTENGTGGDMSSSICAVERDGARFRLRKDATVISYGREADAILVTCRASPASPPSDQVMIVVEKGQYALELTACWDTLGMRGTCSEGFILEAQGACDQIFPQSFADISARSMLADAHILWSSLWYGIAANAVARAQSFVRAQARKSPGTQIPGALRLAELANGLQSMKSGIQAGIRRYESARADDQKLSAMSFAIDMNNLKIGASQKLVEIVQSALMVCGIMGYKNDTPFSLGRHLRDAMSAPIMINNDRIFANTSNLLLVHQLDPRLVS
jgi:acyl-CoA dehydrogenase